MIQRSKNHYQKRAYQCIKMLVALFSQVTSPHRRGCHSSLHCHVSPLPPPKCPAARALLEGAGDLKRKWTWAVEWLHDELERGGGHRSAAGLFWTEL